MTILKSLLVFLPPLALGLVAVWAFWPPAWRRTWPLMLSLSIPIGLGLSSLLYFAWCLLLGPARPGFLILELFLIAAGSACCFMAAKVKPRPDCHCPREPQMAQASRSASTISLAPNPQTQQMGLGFNRPPRPPRRRSRCLLPSLHPLRSQRQL